MKNKNKAFTVDDFIIFLKAKILIISLCTLVLSIITFYYQSEYRNYWEVEISRSVKKDSFIKLIEAINENRLIEANKFQTPPIRVNPISLLEEIETLLNSAFENFVTNDNFSFTNPSKKLENKNLLMKESYQLKVFNKVQNSENIKSRLNNIFNNTNELTNDILKIKYNLSNLDNIRFYEFQIENIKRIVGYEYIKLIKIILLYLTASSFLIFIFTIRKSINLF